MARPPVRDERRAQILDAMYGVIAERGLQGASISEIAEAAGIARGALHYFFASKDEITSSLMRRLGNRYIGDLASYLDHKIAQATEPSSRARLIADLARWHFRGASDDAVRKMAVWIDFWGQAASSPEIRNVVVEIQEAARGVLLRALLAQRPELAGVEPDRLRAHAASFLAIIEGGLLQWRMCVGTPAALPREILSEAIAAAASNAAHAIPRPSSSTIHMTAA